jgi:hypothetical protein
MADIFQRDNAAYGQLQHGFLLEMHQSIKGFSSCNRFGRVFGCADGTQFSTPAVIANKEPLATSVGWKLVGPTRTIVL